MAKRQAHLVAFSIVVLCPYCGAEQPSPGNGSDAWLKHEVKDNQGARGCVSCDEEFQLTIQNKVGT